MESESSQLSSLTRLLSLLPPPNHATLKFILLHLNRVTWFHDSNLMCASNLAVVISPSLGWPPSLSPSTGINHIHALNTTVKLLIRHAFVSVSLSLREKGMIEGKKGRGEGREGEYSGRERGNLDREGVFMREREEEVYRREERVE